MLERLDQQLAKKKVDAEILKDLGWNENELRKFVDRWQGLKSPAAAEGDEAEDAKRELDPALRKPRGIRRQRRPAGFRAAAKADQIRDLNEGYRAAPLEYAERVRAYVKGAARAKQADEINSVRFAAAWH